MEDFSEEPDVGLVSRLLREQVPSLADLPVRVGPEAGSSNWVFRLGDGLAVRLPRTDAYVDGLLTEVRWLPRLGPHLAAPVPEVVAVGEAGDAFPRPWAVLTWVPGALPTVLDGEQQARFAETLGTFLQSLHGVDPGGAPQGAEHWGYRCGEPVTDTMEGWLEEAATDLADLFDPVAVHEAWRRLRGVPAATAPPCWVHTDVSAENVLVAPDGGLAGVIDFGGLGVGDRSVDLLYAWSLLDAPARDLLRAASGVDDETWDRARTWAFVGPGLLTLAGYRDTMPARTARLTRMVETVAAEVGVRLR